MSMFFRSSSASGGATHESELRRARELRQRHRAGKEASSETILYDATREGEFYSESRPAVEFS